MNLLMVGSGSAGSWTIRGHQVGAALGARVTTTPSAADWQWADAIVLVKRAIHAYAYTARATGKPIIWDALDFWSQPAHNGLDRDRAIIAATNTAQIARPVVTICATRAMAADLGGVYVPHHARPSLSAHLVRTVRPKCSVVAYEGNPAYIGRWAGWLSEACRVRGWKFVINPDDLVETDIVVALRDGEWDGWICREWKSGVKLVNAMVAGRPVLTQNSAAWRELQPCGSLIESRDDINDALDLWADLDERRIAAAAHNDDAFYVDTVATTYRHILEGVACPA